MEPQKERRILSLAERYVQLWHQYEQTEQALADLHHNRRELEESRNALSERLEACEQDYRRALRS